ncbi:hypothetical protein DFJ77DRAFT_543593 [Powellomyces hirtus]|nr:hypothetical protein DFJ77DRAFT_543593 [Powellomyces hirtus]
MTTDDSTSSSSRSRLLMTGGKLIIRRQSSRRVARKKSAKKATPHWRQKPYATVEPTAAATEPISTTSAGSVRSFIIDPQVRTSSLPVSNTLTVDKELRPERPLSQDSSSPARRKLAYHHPALKRTDSFSSGLVRHKPNAQSAGDSDIEVHVIEDDSGDEERDFFDRDNYYDAADDHKFPSPGMLRLRRMSIKQRRSIMMLDDLLHDVEAFTSDVTYAPTLKRPITSRAAKSSTAEDVVYCAVAAKTDTQPQHEEIVLTETLKLTDSEAPKAESTNQVEDVPIIPISVSVSPPELSKAVDVAGPLVAEDIDDLDSAYSSLERRRKSSAGSAAALGTPPASPMSAATLIDDTKPAVLTPPMMPEVRPNPTAVTYRPPVAKSKTGTLSAAKPEKRGLRRFFRKLLHT